MITVTLPFKRETKNMLQFQADEKKECSIPTLYVAKTEFQHGDWPAFIEITVKVIPK